MPDLSLPSGVILLTQALLERFEFFPVKCRVQRALEISQREVEKDKAGDVKPIKFKTKASPPPWPF